MQAVLRFQPIERRGLIAIGVHNSRRYTEENRPDHIDVSRSGFNKILIGPVLEKIPTAMHEAIAGIPMARKSSDTGKDIVMCECLLSASPEFFQADGNIEKWSHQSVCWLKAEFGEKILSAVLHLDEQTPHIHAIIRVDEEKSRVHPVTKERMPSKRMLCYSDKFVDRKEVLIRARIEGRSHLDTKLGRFQTRYAEAVKSLGLERGRESARTKDKSLVHTKTKLEGEVRALLAAKESEFKRLEEVKVEVEQIIKKIEESAVEKGNALYRSEIEAAQKRINDIFLCKKNPKIFLHIMKKSALTEDNQKRQFLSNVKKNNVDKGMQYE